MIDKIRIEAERARRVMETNRESLGSGFKDFPKYSCGNASEYLANWLVRIGTTGVVLMVGYNSKCECHAWLEHDGYIIDITADQFDGFQESVFVSRDRNFHQQFQVSSENEEDEVINYKGTEEQPFFDRFRALMKEKA